jgi:hypothetical protein
MKTLLLLAVLSIGAASAVQAQIPQVISYQGYMSSNGAPYTGPPVDMSFTLYSDQSGTTQVWNQQISGVTVVQGYYTVILDFGTQSLWQNGYWKFDHQYWLEVLMNNKQLSPRVQFTAAPYSMNALKADTATTAYTALNALKADTATAAYTALNTIKADTASVALKLVPDAPIGTIVAYAGQALGLPVEKANGWYVCDGSLVWTQDFPLYAQAIGSIYGTNPNGDSVYLPDFRGLFLRGVNQGRSDAYADPDDTTRVALNGHGLAQNQVGSIQLDAMHQHFHYLQERSSPGGSYAQFALTGSVGGWFSDPPNAPNAAYTADAYMGGTGYAEGGNMTSENRPKNAYVFWLIKVK